MKGIYEPLPFHFSSWCRPTPATDERVRFMPWRVCILNVSAIGRRQRRRHDGSVRGFVEAAASAGRRSIPMGDLVQRSEPILCIPQANRKQRTVRSSTRSSG